jgi:IS6 family transposase
VYRSLRNGNGRGTYWHNHSIIRTDILSSQHNPKALKELKTGGVLAASCELRQSKYLNNLVEQDHRFIKRLVKPGMGFFSFETAWRTLQGYEAMNKIRKGQMQGVEKGDSPSQATFIAELFEVAI